MLCFENYIPAGKAKRISAVAVRENVREPLKLGLISGYPFGVYRDKKGASGTQKETRGRGAGKKGSQGVLTINIQKTGNCDWEASENMGCNLRQRNFSTFFSLFSRFGYIL